MILTFGEILLRFSPSLGGTWLKEATMPVFLGGAELNVATALGNWLIPVAYSTALPENIMSTEIIEQIKSRNIQTHKIISIGDRIGLYFIPQGNDLKASGVIYDRAGSSFSQLTVNNIHWDIFFENVTIFQMSAISTALSQNTANLCIEAAKQAKKRNILVAFDLNYRAKLWQYDVPPTQIIREIAPYCDLFMGNIWAANKLLGISIKNLPENPTKADYLLASENTSVEIRKQFPNISTVANTFRFDYETSGIEYYATWCSDAGYYTSKDFFTDKTADKIGSGDCFMAGLLYGIYQNQPINDTLNFAASAAFGKLQETGDSTRQTIQEILNRL